MISLRWLPNAITLARMFCALPLFLLVLDGQLAAALWLFLLAGLSDGLDGWLARRFHWQSELGGYIDPLADKLLILAAYLSLGLRGWLPWWLTALVILRDLVIVGGAFAWHFRRGPLRAEPLLLSRVNTVLQMALIVLVLLQQGQMILPGPWVTATIWLVTISTVSSGLVYVIIWARKPGTQGHRP